MALNSLTIATQGLLDTAQLIAVQGLLDSSGPVPPTPTAVEGGGGFIRKRKEYIVFDEVRASSQDYLDRSRLLLLIS